MRSEEKQLEDTSTEADEVEQSENGLVRDNCNQLRNDIEVLMAEFLLNQQTLGHEILKQQSMMWLNSTFELKLDNDVNKENLDN